MKIKFFLILVLFLGIVLGPIQSLSLEVNKTVQKSLKEEEIYVTKEIKKILEGGLASRQGRQDIPFAIIKHLYFPAQENMHSVFVFEVKNEDLEFEPKTAIEPQLKMDLFKTEFKIFLQIHRMKKKIPEKVVNEFYIPASFPVESTAYNPENEEIYTFAFPLPAGDYLLAMALTSPDEKKIGSLYFEFSLPELNSFANTLGTTPILFLKGIKEMSSVETTLRVHRDFFTYSVLQIEPKVKNVFSSGETLDIFYFIFGAQPDESGNYRIETTYEIMKAEEKIIKFESITYHHPFISQPLPLKRTMIIKSEEGEERKETRNLKPGHYTLSINIKDIISRKSLTTDVDFEILPTSPS